MESKQIVLNGLVARYYFSQPDGFGEKPTVLFLHGWRSEGRVWQGTMKRLAEEGIASFALDLPGFGSSEPPRAAWAIKDYCAVVGEFVEKIRLSRLTLAGHSFGGRIAIRLASEGPDWLEKVVLIGSHGFRDASLMRQVKLVAAKLAKPFFALRPLQPLRRKIYSWMGAEDYLATPSLQATFVHIIEEDLQPCMRLIRQRTCLIWGSDDKETPVSFGQRMSVLIPDARLWVIAGAGHYSFLERPKEFSDIFLAFLNQ